MINCINQCSVHFFTYLCRHEFVGTDSKLVGPQCHTVKVQCGFTNSRIATLANIIKQGDDVGTQRRCEHVIK